MKVCTDSCLFGAWISIPENTKNILDIGTGTGLLSLMLSQRFLATVDAVEIDKTTANQAFDNIQNSPWKNNINVINADIKNFITPKKYNLIICNPPFYENEFLSKNIKEKTAKHAITLNLAELLQNIHKHLHPNGAFAILLPYKRKDEFNQLAETYGYFPYKTLTVQQTPLHQQFRYMAMFSTQKHLQQTMETIAIKEKNDTYSDAFTTLLSPYYLHL